MNYTKEIELKINQIRKYYDELSSITTLNILCSDYYWFKELNKMAIDNYCRNQTTTNLTILKDAFSIYVKIGKKIKRKIINKQLLINLSETDSIVLRGLYPSKTLINDMLLSFINNRIWMIHEEIYIAEKHPYYYIMQDGKYIFGGFNYKYKNDIVFYDEKKTFIKTVGINNEFAYFSYKNGDRTILNVLAFLSALPNFIESENKSFNNKFNELYSEFNICDCLEIRKKDYFKCEKGSWIYLKIPALKNERGFNIVEIKHIDNPEILELYHASLKQFEPLPRCIMLYRVVECAFDIYKKKYRPKEIDPETILNHYWNETVKTRMNPVFFQRFHNGKKNLCNLITILKKEAKIIIKEWSNNKFLNKKTIGEIIYLTGRNFSAHGGNGARNARYDYGKNYQHINNVNILLELIARYVVELSNPNLKRMVLSNKKYYEKDNW